MVAGWIYAALTTGNASAWHYWWLDQVNGNQTNEGLMRNGVPAKRFYVVGNWSKFVRPGFTRVNLTGGPNGVDATAFLGPDGTLVLVAINTSSTAVSFSATIQGVSPATLTPWTTSASANLNSGTAIKLSNGRFTGTLPGSSVVSFVGK